LEDVESQIEVYDVGGYEFFDASGLRSTAIAFASMLPEALRLNRSTLRRC
jgi:hypothetical protein